MLRGEKTILRPVEERDLRLIVKWRNAAREHFCDDSPLTMEEQKAWFENCLKKSNDEYFIIETKTGTRIGTICLYNIDIKNQSGEFGRLIIGNSRFLNKGYAYDASKALLSFGFNKLNLNRIYLNVFENNNKAIALYKRLGFVQEGTLREVINRNDKRLNIIVMSILHREFNSKFRGKNGVLSDGER